VTPAPFDDPAFCRRFDEMTQRVYSIMDPGVNQQAACLYWSFAAVMAAKQMGLDRHGFDFQMQGGTASFIRLAPEDDDGKETTHNAFSYVFEDSPFTRMKIAMNELPEMHCWAACPRSGVFIDVTTRYAAAQCRDTAGMPWTAPESPPFIMCHYSEIPEGFFYQADPQATQVAHVYIQSWLNERGF